MKTRTPTTKEIDELVSFLPRLYADGFEPIEKWLGGTQNPEGVITLPYPQYNTIVLEFFGIASRGCWQDYDYVPIEAGTMIRDESLIRGADLDQIKTILTYCVRGERFCDGHWGEMINKGHIRRVLQRLAELRERIPIL